MINILFKEKDMKFIDYFAIYETYPDSEGKKKYFEYNILEKRLLEIEEFTYYCYKETGSWSNLVTDEKCLRKMIQQMESEIDNRFQIKEIKINA